MTGMDFMIVIMIMMRHTVFVGIRKTDGFYSNSHVNEKGMGKKKEKIGTRIRELVPSNQQPSKLYGRWQT
jgi:hypothetical protein